jgi:hypothetical protein
VCLQLSFVLNQQKCDLILVCARKLDFIVCFSTGVASDVIGCVSIKWLVLFFNLGSKVLQFFGELNFKRGLDIGVSFIE